ncbi:MAG: HD domain-containing protein [Planctomycetota bacterium]
MPIRANISEMVDGQSIREYYLVKQKQIKQTRAGKDYLDMLLMDRTGMIAAKMWDEGPAAAAQFAEGDIIKIEGQVGTYNEKLDLKVTRIRPLKPDDAVNPVDFMPVSPFDLAEMEQKLRAILATIENKHLKALCDAFLDDAAFMKGFTTSIASRVIHHAYIGGLLEHTLSVVTTLDFLSKHYTGLNRDILLVGGFLHDIGKTRELDSGPSMRYTTEGLLIAHMVIGAEMVRDTIATLKDFPKPLAMEMVHTVLAHQGEHEWGSPVLPMTREVLIIHFVDNMDAKQFVAIRAEAEARDDGVFTDKVYPLNRVFYRRAHDIGD